jgi:hypothetical protein
MSMKLSKGCMDVDAMDSVGQPISPSRRPLYDAVHGPDLITPRMRRSAAGQRPSLECMRFFSRPLKPLMSSNKRIESRDVLAANGTFMFYGYKRVRARSF